MIICNEIDIYIYFLKFALIDLRAPNIIYYLFLSLINKSLKNKRCKTFFLFKNHFN